MNKIGLKKVIAIGILSLGVFSTQLSADTPGSAADAVDECSKELLLAYFPKTFVNETLKKFKVPENQWDAINKELAEKDKDVIKTVEERAAKINPNLLRDPQQRQAAVKIFRETLFDVFSKIMKEHGVTDDKQIQDMLDDIQKQKALRFKQCMEKHRSADNESNDSDNDSDS